MIDLVLGNRPRGGDSASPAHPLLQYYYQLLQNAEAALTPRSVGQRIGVTSCRTREGVSTVATNLALAAAAVGDHNVCLLEANVRRPSMHKTFEGVGKLGFADVLGGKCEPEDAIYRGCEQSLWLIPAGSYARSAKLARTPEMAAHAVVTELQQDADWLIVDLPVALDPLSQAVSSLLDGVILVVQANRATTTEIERIKSNYLALGVPVLGAVFRRKYRR